MNGADNEREDAKLLDGSYGVRAQYPELNADIDNHDLPLRASGGWCAPSEVVYDLASLIETRHFDHISVERGGLRFERREFTEREKQVRWANSWLAEHSRRHVAAHIGDINMAQHDAIHAAVYWARTQPLPWNVWTHKVSHSRFVGITVWPSKSGVCSLHEFDSDGFDEWGHDRTMGAEDWCEMFEEM